MRVCALLSCFLLSWAWLGAPCLAATITVEHKGEYALVTVIGTLTPEDGQAFADKISGIPKAIVFLSSPGGSLGAGLRMGTLIRLKNYVTVVPDDVGCASACAFAWLGGAVRYMGPRSKIGFHAAYTVENGQARETGAGNALVGAYLNRLGLSDMAILYITAAPPSDITWLTIEDARQLNIKIALLARTEPQTATRREAAAPPPSHLPPASPAPNAAPAGDLDHAAREFATTYFAHWSENNEDALRYFSDVYGEKVNLYTTPIPRQIVLNQKRKYAERWPERIYTADPRTLQTKCDRARRSCEITGQVEWECRNPKENTRAAGLAKFTLQITFLSSGETRVDGEWSSVVASK